MDGRFCARVLVKVDLQQLDRRRHLQQIQIAQPNPDLFGLEERVCVLHFVECAEVDIADAKILLNTANIIAETEAFGEDADAKADADASANGYAYIWKKGGVSPPQPPPAPPAHPWGKKKWGKKKKSWGKKKPSKWQKPKWGWKSKDE